jgi:cell division protein FtsB
MKKVAGISILIILMTTVLSSVFSCSKPPAGVSQAEYDVVQEQLNAAKARIAQLEATPPITVAVPSDPNLQDEVTSLKAQITDLGNQITALNAINDGLKTEKASLEAQYADLNAKYQDLQQTLTELTQPKVITEELIENEIMRQMNQERVAAGVPELEFGKYLYNWASQNNREMESLHKFVYNPAVFYQEDFFAAGYDSVESLAHGAILIWKANQYNFSHGALLAQNKYGAVNADQVDEIFYITFMAAPFP